MEKKTVRRIARVLIVDDDADDRQLFIEGVKEFDNEIECMTARDGQQALDLLMDTKNNLPQLIFLDLRMPKLGGSKCLEELKKNPLTKNIPVIIYTTSRSVSESDELMQKGADHFVSKPSNPEEIYFLLSVILEENQRM